MQRVVRKQCTWIVERLCERELRHRPSAAWPPDSDLLGGRGGAFRAAKTVPASGLLRFRFPNANRRNITIPSLLRSYTRNIVAGRLRALPERGATPETAVPTGAWRCSTSVRCSSAITTAAPAGPLHGPATPSTGALTVADLRCNRSARPYNLHADPEWIQGVRAIR
ncbi:MAG: hypothetical protein ACLR8Y_18940 [Alistipes indistinctus]